MILLRELEMIVIERSKEYDSFGPWIYEIDEEHEMPAIFRKYYNENETPLILFKVPRNIERRNATPNTDLYDYLVGAYDEYLHIYKRSGQRVTRQKIYYNDISAVKDTHALLKGEFVLFTQNGPAIIEYNTVSEEIILKLIDIIEKKICVDSQRLRMESIPVEYSEDESTIDILFFNLFGRLQSADPGRSLIAYQPAPHIQKTRVLRQRLKAEKLVLSKTAFIINEKELIVLERNIPVRKNIKAVYDYSYLYIPFQSIIGAALNDFDDERYLLILRLKVKHQTFPFIFESGNRKVFDLYHKLHDFNRIA